MKRRGFLQSLCGVIGIGSVSVPVVAGLKVSPAAAQALGAVFKPLSPTLYEDAEAEAFESAFNATYPEARDKLYGHWKRDRTKDSSLFRMEEAR